MITLVLLALAGYSAFNSNTDHVTVWMKQTNDSFFEASETPHLDYPSAGYLGQGLKEIVWAEKQTRPTAFVLPVPVVKKEPKKTEKKTTPIDQIVHKKQFGDTDDLGLLDKKESNLGVNTEEILSYFEKKPKSKLGSQNDTTLRPQKNAAQPPQSP